MPKVSVIIPIYKVERFIERCVRSLFEQTLDDMEYIFVDDCSPDNSLAILQAVLSRYPNRQPQVTILSMENNCGQAAVRKYGVMKATGDYIIHCDSDDWVDVTAYEKMYNLAMTCDSDMVVCDYSIVTDGSYQSMRGCHDRDKRCFFENILAQIDVGALWNKMCKSSLYNDLIWPKGNMGEDLLISIQQVYNSQSIVYLPQTLYYYNRNNASISASMDKEAVVYRFYQSKANVEGLKYFFIEKGMYDKYHDEIDRMLFNKKNLLRPLIAEKKYYRLWKDTFSELNYRIFLNKKVTIGMKAKHILTLMNLYHKEW